MASSARKVAEHAAKIGGSVLKKYFESSLRVDVKADSSFVTEADTRSEAAIREIILAAFPDHSILGEEDGETGVDSDYHWIIDPLDGTTNFINGIPIFAVSIALEHQGSMRVAAIYNPITNSLFSAERGNGAFWNTAPMHVSDDKAHGAMVTIGRSRKPDDIKTSIDIIHPLKKSLKYVRVLGSAALEMAYVARGGTEGYINLGTKLWDYAAGTLLIEEAGGKITALDGKPWTPEQHYFVASNGVIHEKIVSITRSLPQAAS